MIKITNSNKTIISNIFSLSILNALNMALPLISVPYLIATIGSANYGAYSISYTILQYVLLIGAFGFNCTATKQIAQNRDNEQNISKIFYSTLLARFLLTIAASVILSLVVLIIFPQYILLYILGLGIVFGDILNPVWLFQGFENMKYMTIVNAISKIVFTLLIFIFIKRPEDYVYITLLNSAGFLMAGIISFFLAIRIFKIKYTSIKLYDIFNQIREASVVFFSSAFVSLYNNSFVFILGIFLSESSIGIYAAVDKIIKAAKSITEPISTALFPHVAKSFVGNNIGSNVNLLFKYTTKITIPLVIISVGLFLFAPFVCNLFLKSIADDSIILIRLMSPLVIIGGLNYMLGIVGLINLGLQKVWFKILIISSITAVIVLLVTVNFLDYYSAVISSAIAELLIFSNAIYCLKKLNK